MAHAILSSVAPPGLRSSGRVGPCRRPGAPPRASSEDDAPDAAPAEPARADPVDNVPSKQQGLGKGVNLFDPAATASRFITRRFGFTGGLVFVGLLASVEGREIVGALLERDSDGSGETVATPSGLTYVDARVGGGVAAKKGDFVGVHLLIEDLVTGAVYLDTKANKKPVAFIFQKKPLLTPVCEGLEEAVAYAARRRARRDGARAPRLRRRRRGARQRRGRAPEQGPQDAHLHRGHLALVLVKRERAVERAGSCVVLCS